MGIGTIFSGVFMGVLQLLILTLIGALLAILSPLDPVGERKFTLATYYVLLPLYCVIEIARAVDISEGMFAIALLVLSFTVCTFVSAFLGFLYCKVFKVDFRVTKSFVIVCTFGSVTAFPVVMSGSMCEEGGLLAGDPYCEYSQGYALIGLLMLNVYLWAIAPLMVSRDKVLCYSLRRKCYLLKEFYDSMDEFLNDQYFTKVSQVQQEKHAELLLTVENEEETTMRDRFFQHPPDEHPHESLEDDALIEFSLEKRMSASEYEEFRKRFDLFLQKIHPKVFEKIKQTLPRPLKPVPITFTFILYMLASPPIIASVLGFIIGLIPPVKDALFHDTARQVFMKTLSDISGSAIPMLVMLLGAKLSHGFTFTRTVNLRVRDLVALLILRLVVIPAIGIGFVALVKKSMNPEEDNRVLDFIIYAFWNVPPTVLVISTFIMVGYYSKEIGILQFWSNALSAISMALFYVLYFSVFPS